MTKSISPFTDIPAEPIAAPTTQYPYLVVRIMSAFYQRERIDVRQGEPAVQIGTGKSFVQHPEPWLDANAISEGCRNLLLKGVIAAVDRTKFRMCIVWDKESCSFVERDGVINESTESPSGGVNLPRKLAFDQSIVVKESETKIGV